jgi:AcrR family transcriptional regulator
VPRISDLTRETRRRHILASAWKCFSRNGFHATSMDDVIEASGMSSTTVYRYFRSKDDLIAATTDEGLARVRGIFVRVLEQNPCPPPGETLALLVEELENRVANPDYDMTRIALQTWSESLRDAGLRSRVQALYVETLDRITELAAHWRTDGHLPPDADPPAVAATLFSLMHGLIVMHHLVHDVAAQTLRSGLAGLGAAVAAPVTAPVTAPPAHPTPRTKASR